MNNAKNTTNQIKITADISKEEAAKLKSALEQRRFQVVIDEMNAAVFEWDLKTGEFYSSPAYQNYAISQVNTDDILHNRGPKDIVYPDDSEQMQKFFDETAAGKERVDVTLRLKMIDGRFQWSRIIGLYYKDEFGVPSHTIGVIIDETVEHQAQEQLQNLVDEVPTGIGIYEIIKGEVSLKYLNNAYYNMLGSDRENRRQYYGTNAMQAAHEEDRETLFAGIKKLMDGEAKVEMLHRIRNHEGKWVWLKMVASVIERKPDYLRIYAAFHDCDEMIHAQQELLDSRTRLQAALNCAKVIEWRYDYVHEIATDTGTLGMQYHLPKRIEHISQVLEELVKRKRVHESSVADFWWMHDHCKDGKTIQKEIRYIAADGLKYLWYRVIFSPLISTTGESTEVICTGVDITEQKERELAYEEQLRLKKVTAHTALATASYNLTQNMVMEAECMDSSVPKVEVKDSVDAVLSLLVEEADNEEDKKRFAQVRDCDTMLKNFERGCTHIEIQHHLKNDQRWVQTTFDMVVNPYTEEVEAIAILRDISEEIRAELVINKLLAVDYQAIITIDAETGKPVPLKRGALDDNLQEVMDLQKENGDNSLGVEAHLRKYGIPGEVEKAVRENSLPYVKEQLEKAPIYVCLYALKKDGKIYHKRSIFAYLEENKTTLMCAIQDVTDTFEQEERQKEELARALENAKEANLSKTEFFSRMSHDMRTPMNGILGLADLSLQETDAEVLRQNMAKMKESGEYLLSLINDTLDFQKIESGKLKLNHQVVFGKSIFESMITMIKPTIAEKKIQFVVDNHNFDMDWYGEVDPVRIKQIFVNLLSNAVKFTPEGGKVTLDIQNIGREGLYSHNCIEVIDTGVGMSEDFMKNHLFKPFEQEQNEVTSQYAGSGLGLSIVKSLVEMMNGRIEVESELGSGTTFSVYLDFKRVEKEKAEKILETYREELGDSEGKLKNKKILLVEDHPLNAEIARRLLENAGCRVHWENNGEKGVEAFEKSALHQFDIILMDIRMPVMDGLEAAEKIRKLDRADGRTVPIIAMTANAYEDDVQKSLEAGMNAHLAKPIVPAELYSALASVCR